MQQLVKGFTLLEILLAIAIIGILASIAIPSYNYYLDRAHTASFLTQLDTWREKAAIEANYYGADLCHWDDARFGSLRHTIFENSSVDAVEFDDYKMLITARSADDHSALRPLVVDVVATAEGGARALNIAQLLRTELTSLGLIHLSPQSDRNLVTIQSFSVLLGNCNQNTADYLQKTVSGKESIGTNPSQQQAKGVTIAVISLGESNLANSNTTASQPFTTPSSPQCTVFETLDADGLKCLPKRCPAGEELDSSGRCIVPSPVCSLLEQLNQDGTSCVLKQCPQGEHLGSDGICFASPDCLVTEVLSDDYRSCVPKTCPTGEELNSAGNCFIPVTCGLMEVANVDQTACLPKTCSPGYVLGNNGVCFTPPDCLVTEVLSDDSRSCIPKACPNGEQLNSAGNCFKPVTCGVMQVANAEQTQCLPKTCPSGQKLDTNGYCISIPVCPSGQIPNASGQCHCPGHQHINPQGHCVGSLH